MENPGKPVIKLSNVDFFYEKGKPVEVHALKDINFEIYKGDYVSIFGPSGCGKTTLLYIIAGIDLTKVENGSVEVNGRNIKNFSPRELAIFRQMGIGIIFQQFNLIPSITVVDNVALPMAFFGISQKRRREEATNLLDRLNIKKLANRYPTELSGGQQQRVGIARALANNPPIIIADEPLGNLDSENAKTVLSFLKELNEKDGRTIIMVTHEVWSLKDSKRIIHMKDGAITQITEEKRDEEKKKNFAPSDIIKKNDPKLSKESAAAWELTTLFMRGYSSDEMKRFEEFLTQRLEDKINSQAFMEVLDKPFKEGGVGLWKQRALKITKSVETLLTQRERIEEIRESLRKNPYTPITEEARKIQNWLLEGYAGKLNDIGRMQFNEVIMDRLRNSISKDDFYSVLNLPKSQSGLGFSLRRSHSISEKMELVLNEGYEKVVQKVISE